jgi:hypothetical protein
MGNQPVERAATLAILVAIVVALTTSPLEAQRRPALPGTQGFVMLGGSQLDIAELNARLAAFGYPTFDDQFAQFGFGLAFGRERLLLGFELAGLVRPSAVTEDNRFRTRVSGGYGLFNIGYDAFRDGGFAIQPKLGVGGGAVMLNITDRDAPTFDQVLAQPGRGVELRTGSLLVDGSIAVTYRFGPRLARRGARSLLLGARAGYTQSVLRGEWMREATDAPGGPTAGWGGPHVEFMIGRSVRR